MRSKLFGSTRNNDSGKTNIELTLSGTNQSPSTITPDSGKPAGLGVGLFSDNDIAGGSFESISFRLSVFNSSNTTLNCHLDFDENGFLKPTDLYQHIEGTIESAICDDLIELKQSIENGESDQAFICGHLHENGYSIQNIRINTDGPVHTASDDNYFGGENDCFKFMPDEPAIVCFVFNEVGETPSSGREKLIAVFPQIRDAAHLVTYAETGELCLLFVAENGADIERFGASFIAHSWMSGFGRIEPSSEDGYIIHPMVKPRAFSPDYVFYQASIAGLTESSPTIEFHAGGLLNTEQFGAEDAFECWGMAKGIMQAMKPFPALHQRAVRDDFVDIFMSVSGF